MWAIVLSSALGADIDRGPSGTIVTIRPEEGEQVALVDASSGQQLVLPADTPTPMWLVHPEAWRQAVALAEKYNVASSLPTELLAENARLEGELSGEKSLRASCVLDLTASQAAHETDVVMLRRSRTQWAIGAGLLGVVGGSLGTALALTLL